MKKIFSFLAVCFAAVVLLASCTKKYTVDFDVDGGYVVDAIEVVEGEVITAPTTTKEDMTLLGWYADIDLTEEYDFTQPVTENLTLYAKWGVTLSFDSKGGSAVDPIVGAVSSFVEAYLLLQEKVSYSMVGLKKKLTKMLKLSFYLLRMLQFMLDGQLKMIQLH